MKKMIREGFLGLFFMATASLLYFATGCSGGSGTRAATEGSGTGDTSVAGLEIAQQMSLVTAQEESTSGSLSALTFHHLLQGLRTASDFPAASDYNLDQPETFVRDEATNDTLSTINEILCMVDQLGYADMVNEGNYLAQVDVGRCEERGEDHSSDSDNESTAEAKETEIWTVNSSRASDTSPEIVQFWFTETETDEESFDPFNEIRAQMSITEAKGDSNPFGTFVMDFVGLQDGVRTMTGRLSSSITDAGLINFQMVMDAGGTHEKANALLSVDGTSGEIYGAHQFEAGGGFAAEQGTIQGAFNDNLYLTQFQGERDRTVCLDRQNFRKNVWGYNLYDASGNRKELNGGFGIKFGEHEYGWAGYYGVWGPRGNSVTDGDTVTNDDGTATFTINKGAGRLIKRTKQESTLADFVGSTCQRWDDETGRDITVKWDGTNLSKTGTQECGPNGCTITKIDPPVALSFDPFQWVGCHKPGLGSMDFVADGNGDLSNGTGVAFYTETVVTPGDSELIAGLDLKCFERCPKGNLTAGDFNTGDDALFFERSENLGAPYRYTIDSDYVLTTAEDGDPVTIAEGTELDPTAFNSWGVHSGAMVLESATLNNPWEIWSQDVTYMWEAGPNNWNRYTALINSNGDVVDFDKPLPCQHEDDDYGIVMLNYEGPGNLNGFPFVQIEAEDSDSDFEPWVAAFTIDDGTELSCDGATYFTKQIDVEQIMEETDASRCSGLNLSDLGPPTVEFSDPEMDEAPETSGELSVVEGVVQ